MEQEGMMTEQQITDAVLRDHPMMFRNAVGYGIATAPKFIHRLNGGKILIDKGSPIRFGLFPGSSDMIGYKPTIITLDMVGQMVAIFQGIEIKTEHDRLSEEQRKWNSALIRDGAIAEVWHYNGHNIEILRGERII
jgi:hypothetical protein